MFTRIWVQFLILVIAASPVWAAQLPSLDIGSASVDILAGTVTIPVTLTNISGVSVASVGSTVSFDTNILASPVITVGPAATAASKTASGSLDPNDPKQYTILVAAMNNTSISNGIVAYITFKILATGTVTLINSGVNGSDVNGDETPMTGSSGSITISKATPVITWANPADITYGTALSSTQLNATSGGVAGTFTYTPISGTTLTAGAGQTLSVSFAPTDSVNYTSPITKTVSITVTAASQTISFGTAPSLTYGGVTGSVSATGGASGNTVTFSSLSTDVCTISGSAVTPLKAGTCTIAANQAGNSNFSAANQATQTITISKATPVITWANPADITYGTALSSTQLNASSGGVDGTFTYTSISGTTLTAGAGQTLSVSFAPTDSVNYTSPITKSVSITVTAASQAIGFGTAPSLTYGGVTGNVSATGGASGNTVTFSSLSTDVCTISGSAVTPLKTGICTIAANQVGNSNYSAASQATQAITISKGTPVITWANPADITYGTALSSTQLNATSGGVAGTFTYTPISGTTLTAGAGQTLSVSFAPSDTVNYFTTPITKTVSITVTAASQTISFGTAPSLTYRGVTGSVSATGGASGNTVTFSSLSTDVCTISGSEVTPLKAGICTIAANKAGNSNYSAANQATQTITISKATPVITWANPADITYGTALSSTQLNATSGGVDGTYSYSPVSSTTLTAGAGQTLSVSFTPSDTVNYTTPTTKSVSITVNPASQAISFGTAPSLTYGGGAGSVSATGGASGNTVTFSSLSTDVCTISGSEVTPLKAGTCTIAANQAGNSNYSAANQATQTITISKATPVITWANPAEITYGTALSSTQLNATSGGVAGTFTYTPISGTILTAGAGQTLSVSFAPSDTVNYFTTPITKTVSITVTAASQTISFGTAPKLTYGGGTGSASATGGASGNTVTFSSLSTDVCTISGSEVTPLKAGICTITANQVGNSNYSAANQATQTITISKATPVITWANPADITYGTALSSTQLNASSNSVAGTFTYTPPIGTVLSAGSNQQLSVTFTTSDSANYNTPGATTTTINVSAKALTITANNSSRSYGVANPTTPGFTAPALVGSDTIGSVSYTYAATATATAAVGSSHSITPNSAQFTSGTASNYNITYTAGALTIAGGASQSITFSPLTTATYGDPAITLSATSTSGLPVTFTLVSGPATLSGSTLTITGPGTITVWATQGGDSTYAAASYVQKTITVVNASYTVTGSTSGNGNIQCVTPVISGNTTSCTLTPDTGYRISAVSGCETGSLIGTTYTTGTITASCTVTASFAVQKAGDCDANGTVTIAEVQSAINMFLGLKTVEACVDIDNGNSVSIAEVQKVINSFLGL